MPVKGGLNNQEVERALHLFNCIDLCPDPYRSIG